MKSMILKRAAAKRLQSVESVPVVPVVKVTAKPKAKAKAKTKQVIR